MGGACNLGDLVRFTGSGAPYPSSSFTVGKIYVVGGEFYTPGRKLDRVAVEKDDVGRANGWDMAYFELHSSLAPTMAQRFAKLPDPTFTPIVPPKLIIPPHNCADPATQKLYDSGWSRYRYCDICDKGGKLTKFDD